jgi:hypothetical protein
MAAEVAAARQALQAQPDLLPGQALAAAGQVRPTAQALLQRTSAQAPERTMNMLNAQDAERLNQLAVQLLVVQIKPPPVRPVKKRGAY